MIGGIGVTPIAIFVVFLYAGVGHGTFLPALALLPCLWLLPVVGPVIWALTFVQFPLYGLLLGYCAAKSRTALLVALGLLAVLHGIAVVLFFIL